MTGPELDFDALVHAVLDSRYQWVRLEDAVDIAASTARRLVDAGAATITVDGVAANVHQPPGVMRRFVDGRGLLDDEAEHDPSRPRPYPARKATDAGILAVVDALWLIDRHGCTNYTVGRCSDPTSGKRRGAKYGADMWCNACVARDALDRLAEDLPATGIEMPGDDMTDHVADGLSEPGTPPPSDDDGRQPVHTEQPMPVRNDHVSIQALVRVDLDLRERVGIQRYGTSLQPHNGRDALRDLYEELLDACCYIKQVLVERDSPEPATDTATATL